MTIDGRLAELIKANTYALLEDADAAAAAVFARLRQYRGMPDGTRLLMQCPPLWMGSYPDEVHARNSQGARKGSGGRGGGLNVTSPPTGGGSGRLEGVATALFDARLLAAAAEGAGVDARFVLLNRSFEASANSIIRKRRA